MSNASSNGAGIRFYAPFVFVTALLIAWGLNRNWPIPIEVNGGSVRLAAGWLMVVAGAGLMFAGLATLLSASTTFWPDRESNKLVVAGPFAFSRNPIYVGDMSIYVGIALVTNTAWPIVLLPLVWIVMRMYIIAREEHYLSGKFGESYAQYRRRVRRWL